jgi:hypothetical protein
MVRRTRFFGKDIDEFLDLCTLGERVPLGLEHGDDHVFGNVLAARELAKRVEMHGVLQPRWVEHVIYGASVMPKLPSGIVNDR